MSSSPEAPRATISRTKNDAIESSSSDELQIREIRLLPKQAPSKTPAIHLDDPSDAESDIQPLRTSSKRRRTFVASDSSDEQKRISVGKRSSSPRADEGLDMVDYATSKRRRRFVRHREIEKHSDELASDEVENLADEVDEKRMSMALDIGPPSHFLSYDRNVGF